MDWSKHCSSPTCNAQQTSSASLPCTSPPYPSGWLRSFRHLLPFPLLLFCCSVCCWGFFSCRATIKTTSKLESDLHINIIHDLGCASHVVVKTRTWFLKVMISVISPIIIFLTVGADTLYKLAKVFSPHISLKFVREGNGHWFDT